MTGIKRSLAAQSLGWVTPAVLGAVVGAGLGLGALVVAPLVDSLDTRHATIGSAEVVSRDYLLPDHWRLLIIGVAVVAALGVGVSRMGPVRWALGLTTGVMCAWAIRMTLDLARDASTHNLMPFEAVGNLLGLLITTLPAAAVGYGLRRLTRGRLGPSADESSEYTPPWKRTRVAKTDAHVSGGDS